MAIVRMTAKEARARGRVDQAKVDDTNDENIRQHLAEDGFDPDNPLQGLRSLLSVSDIRRRTGLSQDMFAKALRIPVATLQDWETGRSAPDPVALSFFTLVDDDPEHAFNVLSR